MSSLEKTYDEPDEDALQPFLPKGTRDCSTDSSNTELSTHHCSCHHESRKKRVSQSGYLVFAAGSLAVLLANILLSLWLTRHASCDDRQRPQVISSPLAPLLETEKRWLGSPFLNNSFVGEPGPEVDEAWANLLRNAQIKVSADEVAQSDHHTSVALADGSGFVAELGVYHWLHCLKMVKQYLHLEHYHPEYTEYQKYRQKLHIMHCIEFLREAIMCKADVSIMTFHWAEEFDIPIASRWSSHECVKWDTVENWASQRRLNLSEPGILEPKTVTGPT